MLNELITLMQAAEETGIPYVSLKAAAQRWLRTDGASGLESAKPKYSRDYITTRAAVTAYKDNEYTPHPRKPKS